MKVIRRSVKWIMVHRKVNEAETVACSLMATLSSFNRLKEHGNGTPAFFVTLIPEASIVFTQESD